MILETLVLSESSTPYRQRHTTDTQRNTFSLLLLRRITRVETEQSTEVRRRHTEECCRLKTPTLVPTSRLVPSTVTALDVLGTTPEEVGCIGTRSKISDVHCSRSVNDFRWNYTRKGNVTRRYERDDMNPLSRRLNICDFNYLRPVTPSRRTSDSET